MKEIDETDPSESESEWDFQVMFDAIRIQMARLSQRLASLEGEVADLHHRRRVSRQQAVDQDPEWH